MIAETAYLLLRQIANMVQTGLCEEIFKQNVPDHVLEAVSLCGRKRTEFTDTVGTKD